MNESLLLAGKSPVGEVAGGGSDHLACPHTKQLRERIRAIAADVVAGWRTDGMPAAARSPAGLRELAAGIVRRAGAAEDVVGWAMVALVSEYWRPRLGGISAGRRLLLLPDCPVADAPGSGGDVPRVCGPSCGIATIWAAARDGGWVVESTGRAVAAIGSLLTGQYDGILGLARLKDLEKAFAMLPAFSLPIAAVPFDAESASGHRSCADALAAAAIDVDWVLGLVGVAGGDVAPVADYLPLLREAAEMFTVLAIQSQARRLGLAGVLGEATCGGFPPDCRPLDAAAEMSVDFLSRGGKFLRPFVTLAAFDAVSADVRDRPGLLAAGYRADPSLARESAKAAALAIEIFHKASLVHDDIEDDDAVRYGGPTLHVERGVPSAINAGDYLLGAGYRIMSALPGLDAGTLRDAVAILADAHVRLARGQGAELWWRDAAGSAAEKDGGRTLAPDEALAIYGLKTSPAFEAAVALGVRLAGVQPADAGVLGRYALHVGTGFQVLNDLKDWAGDLENDRRAAGDLLGGRPTLLWALALESLSATDAGRLRALARDAGRKDAREADVAAAIAEARMLYDRGGVTARARVIAADQRRLAVEAVASCRLRRLREVLEFLLDLAVPAGATAT